MVGDVRALAKSLEELLDEAELAVSPMANVTPTAPGPASGHRNDPSPPRLFTSSPTPGSPGQLGNGHRRTGGLAAHLSGP